MKMHISREKLREKLLEDDVEEECGAGGEVTEELLKSYLEKDDQVQGDNPDE